jgi:hypothetical protein
LAQDSKGVTEGPTSRRKRKTWINKHRGVEMDLRNMGVERRRTRILEGTEWASKDL